MTENPSIEESTHNLPELSVGELSKALKSTLEERFPRVRVREGAPPLALELLTGPVLVELPAPALERPVRVLELVRAFALSFVFALAFISPAVSPAPLSGSFAAPAPILLLIVVAGQQGLQKLGHLSSSSFSSTRSLQCSLLMLSADATKLG